MSGIEFMCAPEGSEHVRVPFVGGEQAEKHTTGHQPLHPPHHTQMSNPDFSHSYSFRPDLVWAGTMIIWFHELSTTLSEGICISVLMSVSKCLPSCSTAWCNESPTHLRPHLHPSLLSPRITHAELNDCTVLSHIINTQDHQPSHLWVASFGAAFSEELSFVVRDEFRTIAVLESKPKVDNNP